MKIGGIIGLVIVVVLIVIAGILIFTKNLTDMPIINNLSNTNPSSPQTFNIVISGFAFNPSSLTINKGDIVVWTNQDSVAHTVTSDSGSELSSSQISTGTTYSHTFNTAGTYNYHCSIHTSMKGTITVQ